MKPLFDIKIFDIKIKGKKKSKKMPFKWIWSNRYETVKEGKLPICRIPIDDKAIVAEFKKLKEEIEFLMALADRTGKDQKVIVGNAEYKVFPISDIRLSDERKKQFNKWTPNNWNV